MSKYKFNIGYEPNDSGDYLDYEKTILERTFESPDMPKNLFSMYFFGNFTDNDDEVSDFYKENGIRTHVDASNGKDLLNNKFAHLIDSIEVDESSLFENLAYKSSELPILTIKTTDDYMRTFGNFYRDFLGLWFNDNFSLKIKKNKPKIYGGFNQKIVKLVQSLDEEIKDACTSSWDFIVKSDSHEKGDEALSELKEKINKVNTDNSDKLALKAAVAGDEGVLEEYISMNLHILELIKGLYYQDPSKNVFLESEEMIKELSKLDDGKKISDLKKALDKNEKKNDIQLCYDYLKKLEEIEKSGYKSDADKFQELFDIGDKLLDDDELSAAAVESDNNTAKQTYKDTEFDDLPYLNLSITQHAYTSKSSNVGSTPIVTYTFYCLRPNMDMKKLSKNLMQLSDGFNYENTVKGESYEFAFSGVSMIDHQNDDKVVFQIGNCLLKEI